MKSLSHSSVRIFLVAGLIAMLAQGAFAHTYLSSVYLNGAALAAGDCVRSHPSTAYDSPIPLVSAPDMTCGWLPYASTAANRKCPITAGSSIGIQWHHQMPVLATDDIIDPSHLGPVLVYLAKSDTGAGNVWFKIYEDGYTNGQWAVTKLIANKGRLDVTIPSDIAPGNYLLRGEVLALHNGYNLNGVQPYVGCVELTITGSGSSNPAGVAFPGYYTPSQPGLLFNIYQPFTSYPTVGPALYTSATASPATSGATTAAATTASATTASATTASATTATATTSTSTKPSSTTSASASGSIKLQLNGGTAAWWFGVSVIGGSETTVKVEFTDSGSVTTWTALVDMSYAYVLDAHVQLKAPFSLRLTSSTGKTVTLSNVFSSITFNVVDTGLNYGSASATTGSPAATTGTAATTARPSSTTGSSSSSGDVKVTVHPSSNMWWFAVMVSGNAGSITSVQIKDSGAVSAYAQMTNSGWAYSYNALTPLEAPISILVVSSGKQVTATIPAITANAVIDTNGQL